LAHGDLDHPVAVKRLGRVQLGRLGVRAGRSGGVTRLCGDRHGRVETLCLAGVGRRDLVGLAYAPGVGLGSAKGSGGNSWSCAAGDVPVVVDLVEGRSGSPASQKEVGGASTGLEGVFALASTIGRRQRGHVHGGEDESTLAGSPPDGESRLTPPQHQTTFFGCAGKRPKAQMTGGTGQPGQRRAGSWQTHLGPQTGHLTDRGSRRPQARMVLSRSRRASGPIAGPVRRQGDLELGGGRLGRVHGHAAIPEGQANKCERAAVSEPNAAGSSAGNGTTPQCSKDCRFNRSSFSTARLRAAAMLASPPVRVSTPHSPQRSSSVQMPCWEHPNLPQHRAGCASVISLLALGFARPL
jgi:hypothetical protein